MATAGGSSIYLLLGCSGVGKTLLVKRLQMTWNMPVVTRSKSTYRSESLATFFQISMITKSLNQPCSSSSELSSKDGDKDLGEPPPTLPTVGTNLTDLPIGKKITVRELGGCMGPIWSSYYGDCHGVLYMIDAAKPTQISSSCVQLLSVLSAEQLKSVPVLIIFNKIDLPCYMSLVEMKSLFRIKDIIACGQQPITVVETSVRNGTGLSNVMQWLRSTLHD